MYAKRSFQILILTLMVVVISSPEVFAQNVQTIEQASSNFSDKMLALFKGPIVKISACLVLFMAVGSLLRGRHQVALAVTFAVIAILILAIVASAGMRETARIHSAAATIDTLRSAAENYLASGNLDYSHVSVTALKSAKLLPDPLPGNPFGGTYSVDPASDTDSTHYKISLSSISDVQGGKLSAIFANNSQSAGVDSGVWSAIF